MLLGTQITKVKAFKKIRDSLSVPNGVKMHINSLDGTNAISIGLAFLSVVGASRQKTKRICIPMVKSLHLLHCVLVLF